MKSNSHFEICIFNSFKFQKKKEKFIEFKQFNLKKNKKFIKHRFCPLINPNVVVSLKEYNEFQEMLADHPVSSASILQ